MTEISDGGEARQFGLKRCSDCYLLPKQDEPRCRAYKNCCARIGKRIAKSGYRLETSSRCEAALAYNHRARK